MKRPQFVLFLLMVCLFIFGNSCSGDSYDDDNPCYLPGQVIPSKQNPESFYTVLADEHLQEQHKIAILQALNEWADQTANTFRYQLSFIDMSAEKADTSKSHTIKIYVRDPGPGKVGWTLWSSSNRSAYTFVRPSIEGELFRRVMLHELGHAFNLHFGEDIHYNGPYASVMYPSIGEGSAHLCCPELQAFCNEYGCEVDCINIEKSDIKSSGLFWDETQSD